MGTMAPGRPNYFAIVMDAWMRGQEDRKKEEQARQQWEQQQEERKLKLDTLKFEQNRIKLEDKINAFKMNRQGSIDALQMMQGMPTPQQALPEGIPGPPQPTGPTSMQIPGISIPEAGIDIPGITAPIRYQEDMQAQLAAQKEREMMLKIQEAAGVAEATAQGQANVARQPREIPGMPGTEVPGDLVDNMLSMLTQQGLQKGQQEFTASQGALGRQHDMTMEGVRAGNARTLEQERRAAARAEEATKPLSGEAAKVLAVSTTLVPEVQQLKDAFAKDYQGALWGITTGKDRKLVRLVDQVADKVGRLRSGGAINRDEEARFKKQIASPMDMMFGNSQTAIEALDGILAEASQVSSSIRPRAVNVQAGQPAPRLGSMGSAPRAQNAQGQIIEWNGREWAPVR